MIGNRGFRRALFQGLLLASSSISSLPSCEDVDGGGGRGGVDSERLVDGGGAGGKGGVESERPVDCLLLSPRLTPLEDGAEGTGGGIEGDDLGGLRRSGED